jgi:hypothetical protein
MTTARLRDVPLLRLLIAGALLLGCGAASTVSAVATEVPTTTPTPQPPCVQLVPGSTPFSSVSGVSGIQLPAGTYISAVTATGGGTGQYTVQSYTLCFPGAEADIDGGNLLPSGTATSTIGHLVHSAWTLNNLFPDPTSFSYLDGCSSDHNCLNTSGSPDPFTFVGFDQYASHSGGYTTFRLQVATIAAPACLNDPTYYSGTPSYTLFYDGNSAAGAGNPQNHFQMPPATRVSTFKGGGTPGSTYVYYCSAGTQASVVGFLSQAMQNVGWTISNSSASGFSASHGSNPTYSLDVLVQNPNNYYLRIFRPM